MFKRFVEMKKLICFFSILISIKSFSQQTGTIIDSRDGKVYKTVVIGNQTWMAENLNVSTFRNGDPIPEVKDPKEWNKFDKLGKPAWCYYKNKKKFGKKYGRLYNWYAVTDPRGLSPENWHIPNIQEWTTLNEFLGINGAYKMKTTSQWIKEGNGNNESGFSGLPAGYRNNCGDYITLHVGADFWSSTEYNQIDAYYINLVFREKKPMIFHFTKGEGYSVRCIKN
jgi:uncharacterized protein (TIGR02145 family)